MKRCTATARPRIGLLGNPSDGYGGKGISCTFHDFAASVTVQDADAVVVGSDAGALHAPDWPRLFERLGEPVDEGGALLLAAALKKFADHCETARIDPAPRGLQLSFTSDIPRQVGLGGSSAIVIAALRALMQRYGVAIEPATLAELALAAETEELAIPAGPQDRVVQAYEGLLYMDFAAPRTAASYVRLSPSLLPPLFVAWDPRAAESSAKVHDDVRARYAREEPAVLAAMRRLAELAGEGRACLERGDLERFGELVNENFDTRAPIWSLQERHREMVALGRRHGAAVKFCGSGGAVVGILSARAPWREVHGAYRGAGFSVLRPTISGRAGAS